MTSTAAVVEPHPNWGSALVAVLAVHAMLAAALLRTAITPSAEAPPAAILIDLAAAPPQPTIDLPAPVVPEPVAIEVPELELPPPDMPAPVQVEVAQVDLPPPETPPPAVIDVARVELPAPDMPVTVQIEVPEVTLTIPEMPALVAIEVARVELPPPEVPPPVDLAPMLKRPQAVPPPATKPRPPRSEPGRAVARAAPPAVAAPPILPRAERSAAQPTAPSPAPSLSVVVPSWQGAVLAQLERNKRYPSQSRSRHQEGTARVRFTVDREGNVAGIRLLASSGHPALDEETLALLQRASPLPPPPPEAGQPPLTLSIPVQYRLK